MDRAGLIDGQQRTDNDWLNEHSKTGDRLNNIRGLVEQLSAMEIDLRAWSKDDPTLSAAWRQKTELYLNNPQSFKNFVSAYNAATGAAPAAKTGK